MDNQQITQIIQLLQSIQRRPLMYGRNRYEIWGFLGGLEAGLRIVAPHVVDQYNAHYQQVFHQRGWKSESALHPILEMTNKGWSDAQVVEELLNIELETWRLVLSAETQSK